MGIILIIGLIGLALYIVFGVVFFIGLIWTVIHLATRGSRPKKRNAILVVPILFMVVGFVGTLPFNVSLVMGAVESSAEKKQTEEVIKSPDTAVMEYSGADEFVLNGVTYYRFDLSNMMSEKLETSIISVPFDTENYYAPLVVADNLKNSEDGAFNAWFNYIFSYSRKETRLYTVSGRDNAEILLESDYSEDKVSLFGQDADSVWFSEGFTENEGKKYYTVDGYDFYLAPYYESEERTDIAFGEGMLDLLNECAEGKYNGEITEISGDHPILTLYAESKDGLMCLSVDGAMIMQYNGGYYYISDNDNGVYYCISLPIIEK